MASEGKASIREVYALNETTRREMNEGFNRIESQIEGLTQLYTLKKDHDELERTVNLIEKRLTALESWRYYILGAFAAITTLIFFFGMEIRQFFFGK